LLVTGFSRAALASAGGIGGLPPKIDGALAPAPKMPKNLSDLATLREKVHAKLPGTSRKLKICSGQQYAEAKTQQRIAERNEF
jgi:hypothetical protein